MDQFFFSGNSNKPKYIPATFGVSPTTDPATVNNYPHHENYTAHPVFENGQWKIKTPLINMPKKLRGESTLQQMSAARDRLLQLPSASARSKRDLTAAITSVVMMMDDTGTNKGLPNQQLISDVSSVG